MRPPSGGSGGSVIDGVVTPWPVGAGRHRRRGRVAGTTARRARRRATAALVLIVSLLSQAIHVVPLEKAAGKVGALYSSADAHAVRRIPHGVADPAARGAGRAGRRRRRARRARRATAPTWRRRSARVAAVVTADDGAAHASPGGRPRRRGGWVKLGPTSAIEAGDGLRYDADRWQVEADADGRRAAAHEPRCRASPRAIASAPASGRRSRSPASLVARVALLLAQEGQAVADREDRALDPVVGGDQVVERADGPHVVVVGLRVDRRAPPHSVLSTRITPFGRSRGGAAPRSTPGSSACRRR